MSPIVPAEDFALNMALIIFSPWNKKSIQTIINIQFPDPLYALTPILTTTTYVAA